MSIREQIFRFASLGSSNPVAYSYRPMVAEDLTRSIARECREVLMLLLIIILILLFGGGGGYYGYSRWGMGGGLGILGTVLLIVLVLYLLGAVRF